MIYFLHNPEARAVKIGYSADIEARVRSLQTACPGRLVLLGTVEGDLSREAAYHGQFAHRRMSGEWFAFNADELWEIQEIIQGFDYESTVDRYRERYWYPELSYLVTLAVNFPCSVFQVAAGITAPIPQFQVMPTRSGFDLVDFWHWYRDTQRQFYPTPQEAVLRFVHGFRSWESILRNRPCSS